MSDIEKRASGDVVNVSETDNTVKVSGYAAVYNQDTPIGDSFIERIEVGAFDEAIGRDEVVFLINHEGLPLARTKSGTLTLSVDNHGLKMESSLDAQDPDVMRIVPKMKRGDLDKMSFAFRADVVEWNFDVEPAIRTIKKCSLHDVSIVTTPAYEGTEIELCSRAKKEAQQEEAKKNFNAARKRVELKKNLASKIQENG